MRNYYNENSIMDVDFCSHGYHHGQCNECDAEDDEIESKGGIDKCLCCGKYKYGNQLNAFQQCIKGCRNPNEY